MKVRVFKLGSSLAVRVPRSIAKAANLRAGDLVEVTAKKGSLTLNPIAEIPTLSELVDRITPENRHDEILVGRPRGKELFD